MTIRFDDIGNRLRAFRIGSGFSADEVAGRIGVSRTAMYNIEKGKLNKIETLGKLADLLGVSVATLLGVGVEYIGSAVSYFERMRQIEDTAQNIVIMAGPISFLLASDTFTQTLEEVLHESTPEDLPDRARALADISSIIGILQARKEQYRARRPSIVNLISAVEIERFLGGGFVGRNSVPPDVLRARRLLALHEVEHFAAVIEEERIGIQIGVVRDILPHAGFQLFRQADRHVLTISPFRLGEQPNVRIGMAMITSAPEAIGLHQKTVQEMWRRAVKGAAAARYLRELIQFHGTNVVVAKGRRGL
jgi:transcriptional regulator with XRE-family HTH domain